MFFRSRLAVLCLCSARAWATDYYVSSSGNDKGSGASSNPWKSIARVNNQTYKAGDRILFQGGATFSGTLKFFSSSSGTSAARITVTSYGTGRALISAGNAVGLSAYNTAGFLIQNINFQGSGVAGNTDTGIKFYADLSGGVKLDTVDIDQVDVSGFRNYGVAIGAGNGATGFRNVRITNVRSHDNGLAGIDTWGPSDPSNVWYPHQNVYIGHCVTYNNLGLSSTSGSGSGILVGAANGVTIERSVAYNNGINNVYSAGPFGIWTYDSTNVVIQYNEAHHNHSSGSADGGGFDLDGGVSNSILQYNYSHDNDGPGILVTQYSGARPQRNNVVRYNISQNDSRRFALGAVTVYNAGTGVSNLEVFNNTIYVNGGSMTPWAVHIASSTTNVHFRNNIFFTAAGAKTLYVCAGQSGIEFQRNNYWNGGSPLYLLWGSSVYTDSNSWRFATNQETVNGVPSWVSAAPLLTSPGGGGTINNSDLLNTLSAYKILSGSPMINGGLNLQSLFGFAAGANDFYGVTVPRGAGGYDIGASEF